ncbi:hypothetical protein D6C78_08430 [Aureobasidium pullulans]|uniref:Uncharacterized protein n=1 Tax=Aureobasidium pullulans TaxID=5580 RepID=A0A4T0BJE9_AURPU|nr:hypothetical protein D6C78_08430 [Aureobasidium pullulans]
MVATLDATFHWDAVILDHSAFVTNVTCQPNQMSIKLDSVQSLTAAKTNWTGDTIVFVSSDKSCHTTYPGQFGFFNTSFVSYDQNSLTALAKGSQIPVDQAIREFNVAWGQWEAAGSPKTEQQVAPGVKIAALSSSTKSSSSTSRTFDKNVDDFFTYSKDVGNLNARLRDWAPNTGITSSDIPQAGTTRVLTRRGHLERRDLGGFFTGLIKVVKFIVEVVIAVVKAIVTAVRNLAESLLPTWNPSASFTIPVALAPPQSMLDDCPWGDGGLQLWEWSPEDGGESIDPFSFDTLAKMTGADQILTFKINGVEQLPEPGVTVWCVDCGIHGSIYTTGSATFTIIGPTRLSLRLRGDLNANVQIGVDGFYKFERPILEIPLTPDIGLPGFSIPGVITIGPYLTVDLVAKIEVEAVGQILAGVNLDWPEMGMFVDFLLPGSAKSYGFSPIVTPIFQASGEITATASLGIPIGINLGVSVLDGIWEEELALVNTPAIQAVAEYSASYDNEQGVQLGGDECPGIYFYSNVVNSLELEVPFVGAFELGKWEGPKFIEGCINDNGVTTVRQQEQPAAGGETKAGCKLVDNAFVNADFNNGASYWTPLVGHENAENGVKAEGTNGELVKVGVEIECTSDDFDVRLDDFKLVPDASAFMKRDLQAKRQLMVHPDLVTFHHNNTLQARQIPAIPEGSAIPNIPAINSMPAVAMSQAAPVIAGGIALPTIAAANGIPTIAKSQAAPAISGGIPVIAASNAAPAVGKTQAAPVVPVGNAIPTIGAANAAPSMGKSTAAPNLDAANAAPTLPPNLEAPSFDYVPGGNLAGGTYTLGAAVPTATAVFIGENKYVFPAFEDIMKSATVGVAGAAPTGGSGEPFTGWTTLSNLDTRQASSLAAAEDGNFYMVGNTGGASPGTQFYSEDSIAFKDESERMFHYYPNTMSTYGVSRLRAALGHTIGGSTCHASPRWQGSKVFLVSDYEKGLETLLSGDVQWIVTGNNDTTSLQLNSHTFVTSHYTISLPLTINIIAHPKFQQTMSSESMPTPQCSTKQYYATNSPWEEAIGYYRAVRHNKNIYISGTTAVDPFSTPSNPRVLHPGDAAAQTRVTIDEIVKAIKALGGRGAESIVRTKMYVQRQQDCGPVGEVFKDMVGKGKGSEFGCAATMVVVGGFCDPEMLVEIECDAIADAEKK